MITFTNPEVAKLYEALTNVDVTISTVSKTANGTVPQYSGKLSGITRVVALGMVRRGSNLIKLKDGVTDSDPTNISANNVAPTAPTDASTKTTTVSADTAPSAPASSTTTSSDPKPSK